MSSPVASLRLQDAWREFAHDYPDDPEKNAALVNLAIETAQVLVNALADIEKRLRHEHPALNLIGTVP